MVHGVVTLRVARVDLRCLACGHTWYGTPDQVCATAQGHYAATVVAVTMSDGSRWLTRHVPEPVTVWPL